MFSFWELSLIGVIALLVLGPDRLPQAARTAGLWLGKIRRGFASIKDEISRELEIEEMRKQLAEHEQLIRDQAMGSDLEQASKEATETLSKIRDVVNAPQPAKRDHDPD